MLARVQKFNLTNETKTQTGSSKSSAVGLKKRVVAAPLSRGIHHLHPTHNEATP
jgi:hypothetical protein